MTPAMPCPCIYPKELKSGFWRYISTPMLIVAFFTTAKMWEQPKCLLINIYWGCIVIWVYQTHGLIYSSLRCNSLCFHFTDWEIILVRILVNLHNANKWQWPNFHRDVFLRIIFTRPSCLNYLYPSVILNQWILCLNYIWKISLISIWKIKHYGLLEEVYAATWWEAIVQGALSRTLILQDNIKWCN